MKNAYRLEGIAGKEVEPKIAGLTGAFEKRIAAVFLRKTKRRKK